MAARKGMSMAAFIRETLDEEHNVSSERRIRDVRASYAAVLDSSDQEVEPMKRIVISLPDAMLNRMRLLGQSQGMSMAAYIRGALEERTQRERPKPRFGAFASGFSDTGERAGEIEYEPRSWR